MNKAKLSLVVVLFTTCCVLIMLFPNKITINNLSEKYNAVISIKKRSVKVQNTNSEKDKSDKESKKDKDQNQLNYKKNKEGSFIQNENYREIKMNKINGEIKKDKENLFNNNKISSENLEKSQKDKANKDNINKSNLNKNNNEKSKTQKERDYKTPNGVEVGEAKEEISVFKVSKSQIKDKLTILDKQKMLSVGTKLSAIDYEKVNKYLQNGSDEDIISAIKLLKSRLSDKDYDKVKQVAEKFINMDMVER